MNHILLLASASPRRKQLLKQIDLSFGVVPSNVIEDFSLELNPSDFVEHYAKAKAMDISKKHPDCLVIGADTIVVIGKKILGKPKDRNESFKMLSSLSGQTHSVFTGVSIQCQSKDIGVTFHDKTNVTFNTLNHDDISYYIDTYKPYDKAGSYGIQDWFSVCVQRIDGCFYNVMGLPLSKFYQKFKHCEKQFNSSL